MDFVFRVVVAIFPFRVKCIHEVKCPNEICTRCAAPNCNRMILVCEFVEGVGDRFGEIGIQDSHGCAKHLDGFEENFVHMFIHHFFGGSGRIEGKDEKIHCYKLMMSLDICDVNFRIKIISIFWMRNYIIGDQKIESFIMV